MLDNCVTIELNCFGDVFFVVFHRVVHKFCV